MVPTPPMGKAIASRASSRCLPIRGLVGPAFEKWNTYLTRPVTFCESYVHDGRRALAVTYGLLTRSSRLMCAAPDTWANARGPSKQSREMGLVAKSALQSDLCQGIVSYQHEMTTEVNSDGPDVLGRRQPDADLERP
jgi:hypothetical protein